MRVVFLGNHTVGVRALQAISEVAEVAGVVAHPPDPEEGIRYESVHRFASGCGWKVMRGKAKDDETKAFISSARPDLLWITDYRYLLPTSLLTLASQGAVNLHPSLLPKYRGRASLNWAILKGETKLGLTAHFVDEEMDSGDIIAQVDYEIRQDQDVGDCLEILYPLYGSITRQILGYFLAGRVPRTPQDHSQASVFPRRKPEDGLIDWNQPARSICDLVRAVAAPYPGAFTTFAGEKLTVWKARVLSDVGKNSCSGYVATVDQQGITVCCGQGSLLLTRVQHEARGHSIVTGCRLGAWARSIAHISG
jgi:methionyl-tRNA formyltransferase